MFSSPIATTSADDLKTKESLAFQILISTISSDIMIDLGHEFADKPARDMLKAIKDH